MNYVNGSLKRDKVEKENTRFLNFYTHILSHVCIVYFSQVLGTVCCGVYCVLVLLMGLGKNTIQKTQTPKHVLTARGDPPCLMTLQMCRHYMVWISRALLLHTPHIRILLFVRWLYFIVLASYIFPHVRTHLCATYSSYHYLSSNLFNFFHFFSTIIFPRFGKYKVSKNALYIQDYKKLEFQNVCYSDENILSMCRRWLGVGLV